MWCLIEKFAAYMSKFAARFAAPPPRSTKWTPHHYVIIKSAGSINKPYVLRTIRNPLETILKTCCSLIQSILYYPLDQNPSSPKASAQPAKSMSQSGFTWEIREKRIFKSWQKRLYCVPDGQLIMDWALIPTSLHRVVGGLESPSSTYLQSTGRTR